MRLFGDWEGKTAEDVFATFSDDPITDFKIILGAKESDIGGGTAFVLGINTATGRLQEVYGSHCSCYDFKGLWTLEDTHIPGIVAMIERTKSKAPADHTQCSYWGVPLSTDEILREIDSAYREEGLASPITAMVGGGKSTPLESVVTKTETTLRDDISRSIQAAYAERGFDLARSSPALREAFDTLVSACENFVRQSGGKLREVENELNKHLADMGVNEKVRFAIRFPSGSTPPFGDRGDR